MKKKPDISAFGLKKDPTDFLEGGAGDAANAPEPKKPTPPQPPAAAAKPEPTVQKLFRLRWDTANALKMAATQRSVESGRRVTETEIVEELIRGSFRLDS